MVMYPSVDFISSTHLKPIFDIAVIVNSFTYDVFTKPLWKMKFCFFYVSSLQDDETTIFAPVDSIMNLKLASAVGFMPL